MFNIKTTDMITRDDVEAFIKRRRAEKNLVAKGLIKGILHLYTNGKWMVASQINKKV